MRPAWFRKLSKTILALTFLTIASCSQATGTPTGRTYPTSSFGASEPDIIVDLPDSHDDCARPYGESSIWNQPIDWTVARVHPDSKKMMKAFWDGEAWIGADPSQYAPNVYFVDRATPWVSVKLRKNRFRDAWNDVEILYGEPASTVLIPIPPEALPASGSDGQLVIVNMDTGEEWGIAKGEKDIFGNWYAEGAYRYSIHNSGIPPKGFGQRGAGIGQFAGIIRPCEVERGYIGHAVTLAYDSPCAPDICEANGWPTIIPPFTKTDGEGMGRYDIPEGARIIIRPDIPVSKITRACSGVRGCIAWVRAMQEFGGFIVDNSNHPKTYPEGNDSAKWDTSVWSADMLRNVPPEWYDVLDWNLFTP